MSAVEARNGRVDMEVPTDEDAKQCARLLKDPHSSLKSVDLRRGLVTSAGAGAIAKALKGETEGNNAVCCIYAKTRHMFGGLIFTMGESMCPYLSIGSVHKVYRPRGGWRRGGDAPFAGGMWPYIHLRRVMRRLLLGGRSASAKSVRLHSAPAALEFPHVWDCCENMRIQVAAESGTHVHHHTLYARSTSDGRAFVAVRLPHQRGADSARNPDK